MFTIQAIREQYTEEKRLLDKGTNLWVYLYVRKFSFYPTWLCLKLGISANQVTLSSILIGMFGCVLFVLGGKVNIVMGAVLINVWSVLDCVDGNLARLLNTKSKYGWFLDSITGFMLNSILLFCMGIGIYFHPDNLILILSAHLNVSSHQTISILFLIFGSLGSISAMFYALIIETYKSVFSKNLFQKNIQNDNSNSLISKLIIIARYITGFGFIEPILLIASVLNYLSAVILFFSIMNITASIYISTLSIFKARLN